MHHWMKSCGILACVASLGFSRVDAADAVVQEFDGWKITIQPGRTYYAEPVPPTPQFDVPATLRAVPQIQPASFSKDEVPPTPEGVAPNPVPAAAPVPEGLPSIVPGESTVCCDSKLVVSPPEGSLDPRYLSQTYAEIYKSIPFIRAEYDANPSYIQDTAVEFLFGKMRPTVIHRGTVNVNHNGPYATGYPYGGYGSPYGYHGYGYGGYPFGFAYPPMQLVVPGTGLRIHRLN